MKRVILVAALVSTGAMAQFSYEIQPIQPIQPIAPIAPIIPVAPVSSNGPTTVWQSGNYTYIEEPKGTTTVFQSGQFTYITPPNGGKQTTCQTIGQFVYCN